MLFLSAVLGVAERAHSVVPYIAVRLAATVYAFFFGPSTRAVGPIGSSAIGEGDRAGNLNIAKTQLLPQYMPIVGNRESSSALELFSIKSGTG